MSTIRMDPDDALGADDYSDRQGIFNDEPDAGARPVVDRGGGGGAAKFLLIGVAAVLIGIVGWVTWKIAHRGSAQVQQDALPVPVTDAMAVPMSGPPIDPPAETVPPMATTVVPTSLAPQPNAAVPEATPSPQAGTDVTGATTVSPAAAPLPETPMIAAMPTGGASPSVAAAVPAPVQEERLRSQLEDAVHRLSALEQQVAVLEHGAPRSTSAPRHAAATKPRNPRPAVVKSEPAPRKEVTATAQGVVLKAVLEGRAWLQLKSGETVTVAAGEQVPGLGAVSAIDAERSEVRFASGLVLR